jgi:thiosulfate dehydrogenase
MTKMKLWIMCGVLGVGAAAVTFANPGKQTHDVPPPQHGGTVVELCDGETHVEVQGEMTKDKAQAASATLMAEWKRKHPKARWDVADSGAAKQGNAGAPVAHVPSSQADTYGGYTSRDEMLWTEETKRFIDEGNAIFHDAKKLGGTVSMSCDMCHPNGSNTHPETYPKFQVQLGRVALLRDMINWCIENPVKGKPMTDDDPRLRALEAYIIAQRKGVALDYGKH